MFSFITSNDVNKRRLWVLVVIGALLRILMIFCDPFLHEWDERYHALVAKNLIHHPFIPMLFEKVVLPFNYTQWNQNHIWLHKPIFSLWQLAISLKLFGVNEIAVRLPSFVEGTLLIAIIYSIAKLVSDLKAGLFAAFFFAFNFYSIHFISGGEATDHVDYALFFYVAVSIWCFFRYLKSPNVSGAALSGAFAGIAVLCKWLPGLFIFPGWLLVIFFEPCFRKDLKMYCQWLTAFAVALIIAAPWYVYTFINFPQEATYEFHYNGNHIFHAVEGHYGDVWYYLKGFPHNYGWIITILIIPAIIHFIRSNVERSTKVFVLSSIFGVYFFYSVIVQTKMPAYTYICFSLVFSICGLYVSHLMSRFKYKPILASFILIPAAIIQVNIPEWIYLHSDGGKWVYRDNLKKEVRSLKKLNDLSGPYVILGFHDDRNIELMFYTHHIGYCGYPTKKEIETIKMDGFKIAVINEPSVPEYLKNDPHVVKISPLK